MIAKMKNSEDFALAHRADMRRHERVPLALFGHFSLGDDVELACQTTDVSESGVALKAPAGGEPGEKVTLHLDGIGQLEGAIVRGFEGGFAISLQISPERQAELNARIQAIYANSALSLIETPLFSSDDPNGLSEAIRLGAEMTRGSQQLSGGTSGRVIQGAHGAEVEFHCNEKA
jgi:hypothetical protein